MITPSILQSTRPEIFNVSLKKTRISLALIASVYVMISFYYLNKYPTVYMDEMLFNEPCYNFIREHKFSSYLYPPIGGFNQSMLIHGRIFESIQVLALKLLGFTVTTMRLSSFLAGIAVLFLTFLIGKEIFSNKSIGILAVFSLGFSHLFIFASHFARPDMMVSLFVMGCVYIYLLAMKRNNLRLYFLSGFIAALAIDIHPPGNVALFTLFGLSLMNLLVQPIQWKRIFFIGTGILLGIGWWFIWHVCMNPQLFHEQYSFIKIAQQRPVLINPLAILISGNYRWYSFFWLGAYHRNIFLLFLFVTSVAYAFSHIDKNYKTILILSVSGVLGLMIGAPSNATWYIIFIYPFFMILLSAVLYDLYQSDSYKKKLSGLTLSILLAFFLCAETVQKLKFFHSNYYQFVNKLKVYIPKDSYILINDTYWLGLKDHARYLSYDILLWQITLQNLKVQTSYFHPDLFLFLKSQNFDYIIADPDLIDPPTTQTAIQTLLSNDFTQIAEISDPFYGSSNFLSRKSHGPIVTKIYRSKKSL